MRRLPKRARACATGPILATLLYHGVHEELCRLRVKDMQTDKVFAFPHQGEEGEDPVHSPHIRRRCA
jgi:hypothetical protein